MGFRWIVLKRVGLSLLVGLLFGLLLNEISFQFIKEANRAPKTVELIIPAGTADQIESKGDVPTMPEEMIFVVGDLLVVNNQDIVDHQLGPVWIPAGTKASLSLDEEENYIYTCSFNATNLFGLDVREPVTLWIRVSGVIFSGVPMAAILALYSLVMWPLSKDNVGVENVAKNSEP